MIDQSSARWFSTGVPVSASLLSAGIARTALACSVPLFLIAWASSHTTLRQVCSLSVSRSRWAVPYVVITRSASLISAASLPLPWCTYTRRSGANLAASRCQLPTSDIGHTSSVGAPGPSCTSSASVVIVLPRPMSSASTPPRPSPDRKLSQASPRSWYGRSVASRPGGVASGVSRRSACPDSRSPSAPSASTASSGSSSSLWTISRSRSAALASPVRLPSTARNAALSCLSSSSTHWPRTLTSGTLSRASSASSSSLIVSSPTARSTRKSSSSAMPKPWPAAADCVLVLVVSFSPSRVRPAQRGSCTPNPAACSSGAAERRKPNAPAVSSSSTLGLGTRRARSSSG